MPTGHDQSRHLRHRRHASSTPSTFTPKPGSKALKHFGSRSPSRICARKIGKGGDQILHGLLPPDGDREEGQTRSRISAPPIPSSAKYLQPGMRLPDVRDALRAHPHVQGRRAGAGRRPATPTRSSATRRSRGHRATSSTRPRRRDDAERSKPFPDDLPGAPSAKLAPLTPRSRRW